MSPLNRKFVKSMLTARSLAQSGFSIVSAIFLLVVLSGLGVAMVRFSTIQHTSAAMDELGTRAYHAARAGVEWGLHRTLNPTPATPCPFVRVSFNPPAPQLNEFTVTVACATVQVTTAADPIFVRRITSSACNRPSSGDCDGAAVGGPDYVRRVVQIVF